MVRAQTMLFPGAVCLLREGSVLCDVSVTCLVCLCGSSSRHDDKRRRLLLHLRYYYDYDYDD